MRGFVPVTRKAVKYFLCQIVEMDQFVRLRTVVEERAKQKFSAGFVESGETR